MTAPVQSLQRAFRILYVVAGCEEGMTAREIAAQTGLKSITAYKLLRTLEREKFLLRLPGTTVRYAIGHAVHELKSMDDGRTLLTEAGRELLKAQRKFPEAHFVLIQDEEGDAYVRLMVFPEHYGRLFKQREFRQHSYGKVSSLVLLAFASPSESERFFQRHPFESEGVPIWKSRAALDDFLRQIRREGWAQTDGVPADEKFSRRVAVPVFSSEGNVLAVFGGYMTDDVATPSSARLLLQLCRAAAASLSRKLSAAKRG